MTFKQIVHRLNRRDTRLFPHLNPLAKLILILALITGSIFLTKNIFAIDIEIPPGGYGNTETKIDTTEFFQKQLERQDNTNKGMNQEYWIEGSTIQQAFSLNKAMGGDLDKNSFNTGWIPGGMLGSTNHFIASLYNRPISGVQYIANNFNNFIGKPAYAANGFGFDQLNGVLTLWKTLRNAVYSLISLFFVILGIMIMLRIKTSPQTTISIQTAIPKIVTTLILVTFSYAIAGLIIDLSYVVMGIILSIVMGNNPTSVGNVMQLNYQGIHDLIGKNLLPTSIATKLGGLIGSSIGGTMSGLTGWIGKGLGELAGNLIFLLMNLYVFILFIKLFFGLAFCYVKIIIKIIMAPLEIGLGVFPGSKTGFSSWLFDLIANISVFPAVTIFIVIASWIVPELSQDKSVLWSPNLLGSGQIVGGLIGMVCILLLAKIPTIVPEAIFKIKPSPYGKDLGKGFFGGISKTGTGLAQGSGTLLAGRAQNKIKTAEDNYAAGIGTGEAPRRWRAIDKITDVTSTLGWTKKKSS